MDPVIAVAIGLLAGVVAGLLGVGGGALFVPALYLFLHTTQITAEGTALVAIIPVALVGAWRQSLYGNIRVREGLLIGCLGVGGSLFGVWVAHMVSDRLLRVAFAVLLLVIAGQLVRQVVRKGASSDQA